MHIQGEERHFNCHQLSELHTGRKLATRAVIAAAPHAARGESEDDEEYCESCVTDPCECFEAMDSGSETESESSQKARSGPIFQRKESRSWAFPSSDSSNVCNIQDHREVVLVKSGFITSDTDGDGRESNLNHGGADRALPEASEVDPIAFDNASEAAEKAGGAAKMAGVAVEKAGAAVETAGAIVAEAGAIVAEAVEVAAAKEAEKHQNAAEKAGAAAAVTGAQSSGSTSTRKKRKKRSNTKQLDRAHLIMYV